MRRLPAVLAATLLLAGCDARTSSPAATNQPSAGQPARSATASAAADRPIRIPLSGAAPDAIVLDTGTAWVLAGEGGTLMQVDLAEGREVDTFDVGFGATHIARPGPNLAAVGRFDNSTTGAYCLLIDLSTGELRPVTTGELGGLTAGDAGEVWALEKADRLVRIDVETATVIGSTKLDVGENVHVEVQWGAGSAWVGSDGLPVTRVDGERLEDHTTIEVPTGIPFLFHGGLMWGAGPTELWAIDPATNAIARHVPLANVSEILALDIDGNDAWLAVRRGGSVGAVLRLDLATGEPVDEFAVSLPAAVRLDDEHAWVASYLTNELIGFERGTAHDPSD
jgi:hypothetical protein